MKQKRIHYKEIAKNINPKMIFSLTYNAYGVLLYHTYYIFSLLASSQSASKVSVSLGETNYQDSSDNFSKTTLQEQNKFLFALITGGGEEGLAVMVEWVQDDALGII